MCSRDPLVIVLATVNFPTRPTRFPSYRAVYTAIRGCISFILTFMLLLAFIVKRVIRSVFPRVSSSLLPIALFLVFFFSVFFFPRALPSWVSWLYHFLLLARKTPFAEDPVNREEVRRCLRQRNRSRASLFLSFLLTRAAIGKHCVLRKQLRRLCRAHVVSELST